MRDSPNGLEQLAVVFTLGFVLGACGSGGTPDGAGADAAPEAAEDAAPEAAEDAAPEAGGDAAPDVIDAMTETQPSDGSADVPADAGGAPVATACGIGRVFSGDFDGDGIGDCVAWPLSTGNLLFHKGVGGGLVRPEVISSKNLGCVSTTGAATYGAADLDGDGRDDLLFVEGNGNDVVRPYVAHVIAGRADGTFGCPARLEAALATMVAVGIGRPDPLVADFTGDGVDDVVIAGYVVGSTPNNNIVRWTVLVGNGASTGLTVRYTDADFIVGATGSITSMTAKEVNGDGHLDLLTTVFVRYLNGTGPGTMTVTWYGKGEGTFVPTPP